MKKAFIEQILFGFIASMGIITFVATSADEFQVRNKAYDLQTIAKDTSKTLAKYYENQMDMCNAIRIAKDILAESPLGKELLDLKAKGKINFDYGFYDLLPEDKNGNVVGDRQPDTVRVTISGYEQSTFWYKFLDKDSFTLQASDTRAVDTPVNVTIRYGDFPSAGYQNIMGTYQLDQNNCVVNMQMYMTNSKWDQYSKGDVVADGIKTPPTYVFAIADGNRKFDNLVPKKNDPQSISTTSEHCFGDNTYPEIEINGQKVQGVVGNAKTGNAFFQHSELNPDGYDHFHIIPKTIIDEYKIFKSTVNVDGNERDKYLLFLDHCQEVNSDDDYTNDIGNGSTRNCTVDPNNEYHYALEDLDAAQSDFDFTDLLLDSTRVVIPNDKDEYDVLDDGRISFKNGYCSDEKNIPPELVLTGCPITINEDNSTSDITWTAKDVDGTIESKEVSTEHGAAALNNNGTITYTPDKDFHGEDILRVVVKDNDGALTKKECKITIKEVNDDPIITGNTPPSTVNVGENYLYEFTAEDVDNDVLNVEVNNFPSWLNINFKDTEGRIYGTPQSGDIDLYQNISFSVVDGRGGSDSKIFNIEVIGDDNNPPTSETIPAQTAYEGDLFEFNIKRYFSDADNDTLKFSISGYLPDGMTINETTGLIRANIAKNTEGRVYTIVVTANDGNDSVNSQFTLTIKKKSECNGPFESTFTGSLDGWTKGGNGSNISVSNNGKLIIPRGSYAIKSHYFGNGCYSKNVKVSFKYKTNNNWNSSDKIHLYINGQFKATYSRTYSDWETKEIVTQTKNNGWLDILIWNAASGSKKVRVDNVKAEYIQ